VSRLVTVFSRVAELISLYSLGFFFITRNQLFLYRPSKYSKTSIFSLSLNILTIIYSSALGHGYIGACHALYSIVLSIISGETSL